MLGQMRVWRGFVVLGFSGQEASGPMLFVVSGVFQNCSASGRALRVDGLMCSALCHASVALHWLLPWRNVSGRLLFLMICMCAIVLMALHWFCSRSAFCSAHGVLLDSALLCAHGVWGLMCSKRALRAFVLMMMQFVVCNRASDFVPGRGQASAPVCFTLLVHIRCALLARRFGYEFLRHTCSGNVFCSGARQRVSVILVWLVEFRQRVFQIMFLVLGFAQPRLRTSGCRNGLFHVFFCVAARRLGIIQLVGSLGYVFSGLFQVMCVTLLLPIGVYHCSRFWTHVCGDFHVCAIVMPARYWLRSNFMRGWAPLLWLNSAMVCAHGLPT